MKLAHLLFKPKWQDKNPQIRRIAVASDNDADLVAALPQLIRNDPDADVRIAALKRLNDYEAWRERSTGDVDGDVRRSARTTYVALLCSHGANLPSLARRVSELDTLNSDELERVASQAGDRDLRAAALGRVTRPALLIDRTLKDPDASLRSHALERIADVAALDRIAESARKTDKIISRRARELATALRIGGGDKDAIANKAQMLCTRMEALLRASDAEAGATEKEIEREWSALGDKVAADIQARYRGAQALVRQVHANQHDPQFFAKVSSTHIAPASTSEVAASEKEVAATSTPAISNIDLIASQARFDAALASAANEAQNEREQRRLRAHEIEKLVAQYAAALEAGDVGAAHALHENLASAAKPAGALPAQLESRLAPLHLRYDELKRWQQWANQQRRQAICADIEALADSNPHPDALATRVREAREEWRRLDSSEAQVDALESALSRRFHALCHRTLKPTKIYFDKRNQLRRGRSDEMETLLQSFAALPDPIVDWNTAADLRQRLGKALHSLDEVDPRERTVLARRIKEAIAVIAPRIDAHIKEIETVKQRLIARALELQQHADGRNIAREARDLQREWTALGHGRRAIDQRQWKEFRHACDAAFGKLDAARKERETQASAARDLAQSILREIEMLHADAALSADAAKAKLRELDARWQSLGHDDRTLEQRYRKLHEATENQLRSTARSQRLSRYTKALEKYSLLRALETGTEPTDRAAAPWGALTLAPSEINSALEARYARVLAATGSTADDDVSARDRLVELEFLAGVETPESDRQRRMRYQVQRLASRMRARTGKTPEIELAHNLAGWFTQSPQSEELETRFLHAARAGIESLP